MKALSWVRIEPVPGPAGYLHARVHVRRWHPGYWLFVLRGLWSFARQGIPVERQ